MIRESELLFTDLSSWEIGPYHGALPGPMRMKLSLDGEVMARAEVETGYLHRGLEKTLELHPWSSAVAYADHLDPEAAIFGELVLCLAVEELGGLEVPERAQGIRLMLCELSRMSSHLAFIVRMAKAAGSETAIHYVLRDRERILDLFELMTGARFSMNYLRYGGVCADVTEGFIERVLEVCELIRTRLKEYNDLFTYNQAFLRRTTGVGILTREAILANGVTGPNARASGVAGDVRKDQPYSGYNKIDLAVAPSSPRSTAGGDIHDRFLIRLREIQQSMEILKQAADRVVTGPYLDPRGGREFKPPKGEAYAKVESPRGLLACHLVSDGSEKPGRVQFRVPSSSNLAVVPDLVAGVRVEDLPVLLASLDISIAEADR